MLSIQTSKATEPTCSKRGLNWKPQWDIHKLGFKHQFYCHSSCEECIFLYLQLKIGGFDQTSPKLSFVGLGKYFSKNWFVRNNKEVGFYIRNRTDKKVRLDKMYRKTLK